MQRPKCPCLTWLCSSVGCLNSQKCPKSSLLSVSRQANISKNFSFSEHTISAAFRVHVFTNSLLEYGFDANTMSLAIWQLAFTAVALISRLLVKTDCWFFKPAINSFTTFLYSSVALASHGIFRHDESRSDVECYIVSSLKPAVDTPNIYRYLIHLRKK